MTYQAFILAAGFGTRLQPLTHHRPKPLVPVCGIPMLDYALASCQAAGLGPVVVNAHYLAEQVLDWANQPREIAVEVHHETPDILGTGGGLVAVAEQLADRFVIVNADVLSNIDLGALLATVPAGGAAMALRPHADDAQRYGVVAADASGVITQLTSLAEAEARGPVLRDTHFTGIHAMDRATLAPLPAGFSCIVRTAYQALVPERQVRGHRHLGTWLDVGDPAAYLAANLEVLTTTIPVSLDPTRAAAVARTPRGGVGDLQPENTVRGAIWIGPDVHWPATCALEDTIVGAGVSLPDASSLTRCVVWDGADVPPGNWTDTVFHDGGALPIKAPNAAP